MPEKLALTNGNSPESVVQAGRTPGGNPKPGRRPRGATSPKQGIAHPETRPGQIVRAAENGNSRVNGHGQGALSASGDHRGTDGDANSAEESSGTKDKPIPGGESQLPSSPDEFVDEIHRRIDLFEVWQRLLRNEDPKIQQRAVEKLTEMRYKGAAALAEEPQQIVIDIDSAVARRAAEGARK